LCNNATCITANNGEQKLDLIATKASQIDVVLVDIYIPKVSELDATSANRNQPSDPPKNLPVVATTADERWHNPKRCLDFGFNSVLPKPISLSQLDKTLRQFAA
jgi:CheY-like chemotaxis protein